MRTVKKKQNLITYSQVIRKAAQIVWREEMKSSEAMERYQGSILCLISALETQNCVFFCMN